MRASASVVSIGLVVSSLCVTCSGSAPPSPRGISLPALNRPGACASVAVARGAQTTVEQTVGTGLADTEHALFDIGSAAKSITAATVVALAQDGTLSPADRISRYLHGVPADKRRITLAQLLTHTSGLPQDFTSDQTSISRRGAVREILALPLADAGRFRYSNAGYTLLAAIVERVTGEPFRHVVQDRLLTPLGMQATGWYDAPPAKTAPVHGHVGDRDTGPAGTQAPGSWATLGAGGMTSTASDLLRWVEAANTGSLLDDRWRTQMFRARVPIGAPGARAAYGWVVGTTPDGRAVRLVGGDTDYGFTSDLRYYPGEHVATVALSCSDRTPAIDLGHGLESALGA